jgi:phage protein D
MAQTVTRSAPDDSKLAVRATEIESLLNDIKSKDFATQTTLAAILAKIIAAPATEAKQDTYRPC